MLDLADLPGRELVERGLAAANEGRRTRETLLLSIAAPRLRELGVVTSPLPLSLEPELELYALLGEEGDPDPYSRYNALLRELTSFVRALERRLRNE